MAAACVSTLATAPPVDVTVPRRVRVGLLWHSAKSGNLGVRALTTANMAIVRQAAIELGLDPHFVIIGMREQSATPSSEPDIPQFEVHTRSLLSPSGYWRLIRAQDGLIDIGGGDSFADIYHPVRFFFIWASKVLALAARKPLLLAPQTIGPFNSRRYALLARLALSGVRAVIARDPRSLDELRRIAPSAPAHLSVDVAFALPYDDRSAARGGERVKVGLNVSGLLFREAETESNRFGLSADYAQLNRKLIETFLQRGDADVHLITHVNADGRPQEDDGVVADRLAAEFPGVLRVPNFAGPCEAKSYISSLDFLIAGRMHACIAAYSAGVPVVPIAYSRKFSGLFNMLDYEWLLPVQGISTEQALKYVMNCFDRRTDLASDISSGLLKVESLLDVYRSELRRFLREVAA